MIVVDGSHGEGGGQILRTSVALSAITGEPVKITNIRAGRENPGLRPQHLKAVEAVSLLCGGEVSRLEVGSREVTFTPGEINSGAFRVDVGTAGSATLVLQAMLPVAFNSEGPVTIEVVGGTDVKWAPTADYFQNVFSFFLSKMGASLDVQILERGFYPKGGGRIRVRTKPWNESLHLNLLQSGGVEHVEIFSVASEHLRRQEVAERQVKGFLKKMSPHHQVRKISRVYVDSAGPGSTLFAQATCGGTRIGACTVGEIGVKAEEVGARVACELLNQLEYNAPLDCHMADQILPYLALAGGSVQVPELTGHALTNIHVLNLFGYPVKAEGCMITASE
ncbi:MAG: RNA 3'-terminal phosphate cyclase [Candidatus Altiarchaeota archaeon]